MRFATCTPPNKLPEVEREVAIALAKVAFFVSSNVTCRIAELNSEWRSDFERSYSALIQSSHFFYNGSACVFPGVRRKASKDERELKRHKYHTSAGAILDLNWFPRELWCFLCAGKQYSAQTWSTSGLGQFELAHVLPHKAYEMPGVRHWFAQTPEAQACHGLFTCAANIILLPKGMAKPTDGTAGIRMAVIRRYFDLYGATHAAGFGGFSFPASVAWYGELLWNEPVEPPDWEARIDALDQYRRRRIGQLLSQMSEGNT